MSTPLKKLKFELEEAQILDQKDPLRHFREQFYFPISKNGSPKRYFCGNSLGLQPKNVRPALEKVLKDWAELGVEGHTDGQPPWKPYHEFLALPMAEVVGALPHEVVVMNSLTVNLHLLFVSFYRPSAKRFKILIEKPAFPSDRYAVVSQIQFHGYDPQKALIEVGPQSGQEHVNEDDLYEIIDKYGEEIALIWIGNVNYYSGQAFDMKKIAHLGHQKGCVVGFDLAHGAGNLDCQLHDSGIDFAVWCGYKYLNSGPGGMAGIFVHERHQHRGDLPRFAGWWGHDKQRRFLMEPDFKLISGAEGWQLSNPPILPMASLKASLDIFLAAGMSNLYQKSHRLTQYLYDLLSSLPKNQLQIITPGDPQKRGAQLSIKVTNGGKDLHQFLEKQDMVTDWREPNVIRVAPVPLYNSFEDVWHFYNLILQYFENKP